MATLGNEVESDFRNAKHWKYRFSERAFFGKAQSKIIPKFGMQNLSNVSCLHYATVASEHMYNENNGITKSLPIKASVGPEIYFEVHYTTCMNFHRTQPHQVLGYAKRKKNTSPNTSKCFPNLHPRLFWCARWKFMTWRGYRGIVPFSLYTCSFIFISWNDYTWNPTRTILKSSGLLAATWSQYLRSNRLRLL